MKPLSPFVRYLLVVLVVIVIDQLSKLWIKFNMLPGQEFEVLGQFFRIHFIENPGAAFGMTLDSIFGLLSGETAKIILTLFSVIAAGFILVFLRRVSTQNTGLPFFLSLILGGALGNIIDRLFYGVWFEEINEYEGGFLHGRVVDMFYVDIWQGVVADWVPILGGKYYSLWPIFNVADAAISIGIVAILIFQNKWFAHHKATQTEQPIESTNNAQPTSSIEVGM